MPETPLPSSNALSLARGTLIACEDGEVAIENIKAGDIVNTLSDGPQVVRWIGESATRAQAVCIQPGALSEDSPTRPLIVTPAHQLVISSWRAELLFGSGEVLVAASALVNGTSIAFTQAETALPYFQILFDKHEIIRANGAPCASFYPSAPALAGLDPKARIDLQMQFPEITHLNPHHPFELVRPSITASEVALLA